MWQWRYVSGRQLDGFRQYKYSAVDTNPLSVYIMQPIWNKIIKIVPLWIAPNLLTFSGFVMILFNYFLISFYDWDYTASGSSPGLVPTWVWLFSAFTTFCAYALDSIDGKHARRTQSSTPLGELFDHGLDSWATSIFVLSFFSVCSRDNGKTGVSVYTMYIYLSIVLFNFMCSHWEKYNTGVLFLPWGYDISQVVLIAAYLLTSAVGVEVWQKPLLLGYYITDILVILLIGFSLFLSFPQTLYNIHSLGGFISKQHISKATKAVFMDGWGCFLKCYLQGDHLPDERHPAGAFPLVPVAAGTGGVRSHLRAAGLDGRSCSCRVHRPGHGRPCALRGLRG
ncbi:ethanolaminephosphotransferase 1-like isoform X5 [Pseudopipra pipra]